jgi:hypothetical protein
MVRTNNRIEAALFIVKDPTSLPERVQWAAVLVGGWITEPSGLVNNNGIVLKYKKAIRTQKKICLTEGFRNGHLEISALIVDSINFHKPKNGWRITEDASKAHFCFRYIGQRRQWQSENVFEVIVSVPYLAT